MKKWNIKNKPEENMCPEQYCFSWVPPKGKADLSGRAYDSLEKALDASNSGVIFLKGGCSTPVGPCKRETKQSENIDCYESNEPLLIKDGLPELFFCTPESLSDEFIEEYKNMCNSLWGEA